MAVAGIGKRFDELRKELGRAPWRRVEHGVVTAHFEGPSEVARKGGVLFSWARDHGKNPWKPRAEVLPSRV